MHDELACQLIAVGNYDALALEQRQKIVDQVPPHVIVQGTKAILTYLGAIKPPSLHYSLVIG